MVPRLNVELVGSASAGPRRACLAPPPLSPAAARQQRDVGAAAVIEQRAISPLVAPGQSRSRLDIHATLCRMRRSNSPACTKTRCWSGGVTGAEPEPWRGCSRVADHYALRSGFESAACEKSARRTHLRSGFVPGNRQHTEIDCGALLAAIDLYLAIVSARRETTRIHRHIDQRYVQIRTIDRAAVRRNRKPVRS